MDMPGIRPDELSISAFRHSLSFIGKHPARSDAERSEADQCSFSCTVALPVEVDADPIDAGYCDGVLTVTLFKRASASRGERQRSACEPSLATSL
jgi:HSP20 family protein